MPQTQSQMRLFTRCPRLVSVSCQAPDFTVCLGQGKPPLAGVESLDPTLLPERFVRVERTVNRTALREALDAGENIPGVYLGNPQPFLTVRKT